MVHVLASLAFTFVALGAFALIAFMLFAEQAKIMTALGLRHDKIDRVARHPVRIRTAGRWQAVPVQAAPAARPRRAAA